MNEDFLDLLNALIKHGARFLVVGAHAMAVHGVVRATGDLDIWVKADGDNHEKVWAALVAFGAPVEALGFSPGDLLVPETVWQIGAPPRRVDILTSIDGVEFDEAWGQRKDVQLQGVQVPVLGLDSLRRNKAATGREGDRLDLELLDHIEE